ncbi:MAG: heparan-alpha-glucosaminide N-acetyltransferase [Rhizobiaceae bacterium]
MSERWTRRLAALDVARGVALAAMAVYHFAWDLEFFGFAEPGMTAQLPWKLFARSIATSFLFLAGVSFFLAHGRGFSFAKFWPRFAQIAAAALAISIATRLAMPDSFIFFGILHEIAAASLIGIFAVRLPALPILALALMAFLLPQLFTDAAFNTRWLAWTGFAETAPRSNDLVTFFPWTAAFLGGLGITKAASGILPKLANQVPAWLKPAEWAGKHSLIIYLVHQPVLIGLVWASAQVFPPPYSAPESRFAAACRQSCEASRDHLFCENYCSCVLDRLSVSGMLEPVLAGSRDEPVTQSLDDAVQACTLKAEGAPIQ